MSDETEQTPENVNLSKLRQKLESAVRNNIDIENGLIQKGVKPNPYIISALRMDLLLEMILTDEQRFDYEIESARRVHGILMQIHQDLIQSYDKLVTPEEGLHVPKLVLPT